MISILLSLLLIAFQSVAACPNGQIRLYNGTAAVTDNGMLQICKNGQWRAVCDYGWTQTHSIVVCKQLGYNNSKPITYANNGPSGVTFGYIVKRFYSCVNKANISSCLTTSGFYLVSPFFCSTSRDSLRIHCNVDTSGCTNNQIRLYNSTTNTSGDSGMLQICDATGHWTAVCDFSWGCNEAVVACKHLGYNTPYPKYTYNGGPWTEFGFGPYQYCSRFYSSLFSCTSYPLRYRTSLSYCNPIRDTVMLNCSTNKGNNTCSVNYDVRLVDGNKKSEGRLEVCYRGQWTSICRRYSLNAKFASTVCNQLGYVTNSFATVITDGRYGTGTTETFLTSPYCRNEYNNIKYCSLSSSGSQCSTVTCRYNRIGLKCYESDDCNEGDVRLVNGTVEREGRLEVCANGVWGQICYYGFRKSAAYVACKQLGYTDTNGALIDTTGKYGYGERPIIYSYVECFGHETELSKCSKYVYPNFTCYTSRYIVGILCRDTCKEEDVRLVGGRHKFEGTVEICLDSIWTVVAQHGWDDDDARVVCRQIGGYNASAGMAVYNSSYGHPKRAIRYTNVYCRGHEEELADCTHHTLEFEAGRTYKAEVAGVDCGVIVSKTALPTSSYSNSMSSSIPASSSTPTSSVGKRDRSSSLFISGLLFVIIAITIMVIGIVIMVVIIARMKKLSISNAGRNSGVSKSEIEKNNPLSIQSENDDVSFKNDSYPLKDEELLS